MKLCGIYRIRNSVDGKAYFGQSTHIRHRFTQHRQALRKNKHDNPRLQHAWNKYGESSFVFEPVEIVTADLLTVTEQRWLNLNFGENCYNTNPNAEMPPMLGRKHSDVSRANEQRAEASARLRGRPISAAHKAAISASLKGRRTGPRPPHTEETKAKISQSLTGKTQAYATCQKRSAALRGRKRPADVVEKIRRAQLGQKREPLSVETRVKISNALKGRARDPESVKQGWITRRERFSEKRRS